MFFVKKRPLLPFSERQRKIIHERLEAFGIAIDEFLKVDKEISATSSENVSTYALNVRSSSDLGARRKREEALENELSDILVEMVS